MINLYNANIESISIHKLGNKSRNEVMFLSDEPLKLSDEITPLVKEFFLKPFREKEEVYFQFAHDVDLEYNDMFNYSNDIFNNPNDAHKVSIAITKHLFEQSNHPHIKGGEIYICHFSNVSIDNNVVDAIGVFKSEIKADYLELREKETTLEVFLKQGISLSKLDKGCLIFNHRGEDGFKILTVDSNRYDARYWMEHFLSIDAFQDENFTTKKYLKFCQDFAKDVVLPAEDKQAEVLFLNKAVDYFGKNDEFNEANFKNETIDNPDLQKEFDYYKSDRGEKYSIEDVSDFQISNKAVTEARKKIKPVIELDTGITIKMDIVNGENAEKHIVKGWDDEVQMYYYLCYFNKES